jgi:hypothetical protein
MFYFCSVHSTTDHCKCVNKEAKHSVLLDAPPLYGQAAAVRTYLW